MSDRFKYGRIPCQVFEIEEPRCQKVYASTNILQPCRATTSENIILFSQQLGNQTAWQRLGTNPPQPGGQIRSFGPDNSFLIAQYFGSSDARLRQEITFQPNLRNETFEFGLHVEIRAGARTIMGFEGTLFDASTEDVLAVFDHDALEFTTTIPGSIHIVEQVEPDLYRLTIRIVAAGRPPWAFISALLIDIPDDTVSQLLGAVHYARNPIGDPLPYIITTDVLRPTTGDQPCFNTLGTCQFFDDYVESSTPLITRYSDVDQSPQPNNLRNCFPALMSASQSSAELAVGGVNRDVSPLGRRATLSVTLKDFPYDDRIFDPYRDQRSYDPLEQGSFWGKWRARHEYRKGYTVRLLSGYIDEANNFAEEYRYNYLLESMTGSGDSAKIQCYDLLRSVGFGQAVFPEPSRGVLNNDIDESATSFELAPVGVGAEYPASFRCRIGGEGFDVTRSGDVCTIVERGFYGGLEEHSEDDTVQVVAQLNGQVHDLAFDIITSARPQLAAKIDKDAWDTIADEFLPRIYTGDVTEPTDVEELLSELTVVAPFFLYADIRTDRLVLDAIREPASVGIALTQDANLLRNSTGIQDRPNERIDEVWVYYRMRDQADKADDPDNFSRRFILVNPTEQARRGRKSIRRVFTRWLEGGGAVDSAQEIAQALISRFEETPVRITFDVDAKDADIWLGDVVRPLIRDLQDERGAPRTDLNFQVIEASEQSAGSVFRYVAQTYKFVAPLDPNRITITIADFTTVDELGVVRAIDLRDLYSNTIGEASQIPEITFVVQGGPIPAGGAVVGSNDNQPAMILPDDWSWSPTIFLRIEAGGLIVGRGGDGGAGGNVNDLPQAGEDGQDGLVVEYPLTITNFGIIGGGGGGGGGGGVLQVTGSNPLLATSGGGGAGRRGGIPDVQGPDALPRAEEGSFLTGGEPLPDDVYAQAGGRGGDLGEDGEKGTDGTVLGPNDGGLAGRAIVGIANVTFNLEGDIRGAQV